MSTGHETEQFEWRPFRDWDGTRLGTKHLPRMRRCPTCGALCLPPCYGCRVRSGEARREYGLTLLRRRFADCARRFANAAKRGPDCERMNAWLREGVHLSVRVVHDAAGAGLLPRWPSVAWLDCYAEATDEDWQGAWDDILTVLARRFPGRFDEDAWLLEPGAVDDSGHEGPLIRRRGRAYAVACDVLLAMVIEAAKTSSRT